MKKDEWVFIWFFPQLYVTLPSNICPTKKDTSMVKHSQWSDEYWLLLMQLYLKKPVGAKALYSKGLVNLALELHIKPQFLYEQMLRLRQLDTPRMERLWEKYSKNPKLLSKSASRLRKMKGFGQADVFFDGVEVNESWEQDFRNTPLNPPVLEGGSTHSRSKGEALTEIMPVQLIMVLDLYFRLTPNTMVKETPEIKALARKIGLSVNMVVEIMEIYQICDPYLNRSEQLTSGLVEPCQEVWQRFGADHPEKLAAFAAQLKERILLMAQKLVQQQVLKQQQVQRLSAQHMLLVKLLEMPLTELEQNVNAELDDNPALEVDENLNDNLSDNDNLEYADNADAPSQKDELDAVLERMGSDDELPAYEHIRRQQNNAEYEEIVYGDTVSFYDKIHSQLAEHELTDQQRDIIEYLIGSLDDDGLLRKPLDSISDELAVYHNIDVSEQEVEETLKILQDFDPAGIGARSLQECLLLQIERNEGERERRNVGKRPPC